MKRIAAGESSRNALFALLCSGWRRDSKQDLIAVNTQSIHVPKHFLPRRPCISSQSESEEEKPRNLLSRRPGLTVDTSGAGSGKDEGKGSGEIAFHYEEEDVGSELVKAIEDSLKLIDIWTTMIEQSSIVEWSELNSAINARVEFVKARLLEIKEM